ncbi:MAG: heme NO-binding domain-containing protein [Verrucomicrobiota bacterium]
MKGIIFNLLEEVVTQRYGADAWDDILAGAQSDGVFTSLGSYEDDHFVRLVGSASSRLHLPADFVIRWFGTNAVPLLAKKYPGFFNKHNHTRSFLLTINGIIHPEVRKLYPGADTPDFDVDASSPDMLALGYYSKRKFCALAEGLITGAADHYGEIVSIHHPTCMRRGDAACRLELRFVQDKAHGA